MIIQGKKMPVIKKKDKNACVICKRRNVDSKCTICKDCKSVLKAKIYGVK